VRRIFDAAPKCAILNRFVPSAFAMLQRSLGSTGFLQVPPLEVGGGKGYPRAVRPALLPQGAFRSHRFSFKPIMGPPIGPPLRGTQEPFFSVRGRTVGSVSPTLDLSNHLG
jgi:hypothetical protein